MKNCKVVGCYSPVFSHLYCQRHQYLRTDKKPKKLQYHIIKLKGESLAERFRKSIDFGFESQSELFEWLWDEAKDKNGIVVCPYTGERLNKFYGTDRWYSCFAHLLPKGKYTYFKLNPKNVRVVFPDFHRIIDQGTSLDRCNHPLWRFDKWDEDVETMKIQYVEFKKQHLLA